MSGFILYIVIFAGGYAVDSGVAVSQVATPFATMEACEAAAAHYLRKETGAYLRGDRMRGGAIDAKCWPTGKKP